MKHSNNIPNISSEKITLRALTSLDAPEIYALRSSTEVNKYLDRKLCENLEEAQNFIGRIIENCQKGNSYYWAIHDSHNAQLQGTICLYAIDSVKKSAEIGYELLPIFQQKGIMSEAIKMVIHFAHNTLKLKELIAVSHPENEGSRKILLQNNFIETKERDIENVGLTIFKYFF